MRSIGPAICATAWGGGRHVPLAHHAANGALMPNRRRLGAVAVAHGDQQRRHRVATGEGNVRDRRPRHEDRRGRARN